MPTFPLGRPEQGPTRSGSTCRRSSSPSLACWRRILRAPAPARKDRETLTDLAFLTFLKQTLLGATDGPPKSGRSPSLSLHREGVVAQQPDVVDRRQHGRIDLAERELLHVGGVPPCLGHGDDGLQYVGPPQPATQPVSAVPSNTTLRNSRRACPVGVGAVGRGEGDSQGSRAGRDARLRLSKRCAPARRMLDAVQGGVGIAAEVTGAVAEDVEGAVRAEGHVHHPGCRSREGVDGLHGAVTAGPDALDPAAAELAGEEVAVVLLRELHIRGGGRVVAVDRATHGGLIAAVVGHPGGLGGAQVGEAGVARRSVPRCRAVEPRSRGAGREVDVGVVLAGAVRPAEVFRLW